MATFLNRMMSACVSMVFLSLQDAISPEGTFFLLASISLISTIFPRLAVPETMGKTLEEIESDNVVANEDDQQVVGNKIK